MNFIFFIIAELLINLIILSSKQYLLGCCLVILVALIAQPKYIFSFSGAILANFGLYIFLPSSVVLILEFFEYQYRLLWIENISIIFLGVGKDTFLMVSIIFILLYSSAFILENVFNKRNGSNLIIAERVTLKLFRSIKRRLLWLIPVCVLLNLYIFIKMGGITAFLSDYSGTFLTQRAGLGPIIVITMSLCEITVFLIGLLNSSPKNSSIKYLIYGFSLILINGFVMGFKSRIIILTILFYLPKLLNTRFNFKVLFLSCIIFFPVLAVLSYIRTNGYYNGLLFIEMIISYFNVLPLHERIIDDFAPGSLFTTFWFLNKIPSFLNFSQSDYDLSIYLTKIYYPNEWLNEKATQQWSLISQIYLNFGDNIFVIIPCIWIILVMSISTYVMHKNILSLFLLFFVSMEIFRFLVIFKGGILHYDLIYQVLKYGIAYLILWRLKFEYSTSGTRSISIGTRVK